MKHEIKRRRGKKVITNKNIYSIRKHKLGVASSYWGHYLL
ncbi:hypothetical protein GMI03_08780 [Staphylococcus pseudintermedius]|nr:hypothetical protein [Staphylococcus pseudintermedius]NKM75432.1 hypothetical protein [Staphylococcus pseudintermedius]